MKRETLAAIAHLVRSKGQEIRENAGYGGAMDDGGGGALIREADAFLAGLNGTLPSGWDGYVRQAEQGSAMAQDPDRAAYLRFKMRHRL